MGFQNEVMNKYHQPLLENNIHLYDNLAEIEGNQGRLKANMVIYPYPRIEWEFESLGNGFYESKTGSITGDIHGYHFAIENIHGVPTNAFGSVDSHHGYTYGGTAALAKVGNWDRRYGHVTFFLPNTKCIVDKATYFL